MPAAAPTDQPITIAARCTYAAHLGAGLIALGFAALACGEAQPGLLIHVALAVLSSALFRARLIATGQLHACANEDATPVSHHPLPAKPADPIRADLLRRYEEVEHLRGTPRFDPWESLELQHRLNEMPPAD